MMGMKLSDYLDQPGFTATALAEKCGVSVSTITRAASGDTDPTLMLMRLIAQHTDGAVLPSDFLVKGKAA